MGGVGGPRPRDELSARPCPKPPHLASQGAVAVIAIFLMARVARAEFRECLGRTDGYKGRVEGDPAKHKGYMRFSRYP